MKTIQKIVNYFTNTLSGKFTVIFLFILVIIISILINLNLNQTLDFLNQQNTLFLENSQRISEKNVNYTIDKVNDLLFRQGEYNIDLFTSNITESTLDKGKILVTNLANQFANEIVIFNYRFIITALNELFKNRDIVYAVVVDKNNLAMMYKISSKYNINDVPIAEEQNFYRDESEGKRIERDIIDEIFVVKDAVGYIIDDDDFGFQIYEIGSPIIVGDDVWGCLIIGFSLKEMNTQIEIMQQNYNELLQEERSNIVDEAEDSRKEEERVLKNNLEQMINEISAQARKRSYIYLILFIIFGFFIARYFGKSIAKPIVSVLPLFKKISKGILTHKIETLRKDEIKLLFDAVNDMVDELNNIILTIKDIIVSISSENENLAKYSKKTKITIETISKNINVVENGILKNLMDVRSTTKRIKKFVNTLNSMTLNVVMLNQSAEATEQVSATGKKYFDDLFLKMKDIEKSFSDNNLLVNDLNIFSLEIKNIIKVIEEISTRTSILAHNVEVLSKKSTYKDKTISSISVEVRNLSEDISDYTSNLMSIVDKISMLSNNIYNSSQEGYKSMVEGIISTNSAQEIVSQINEKIKSDKQMISNISNMIETIDSESNTILGSSENINKVIGEMLQLIVMTGKSVYEEEDTIKLLNESVTKLYKIADLLNDKMKEFVVNE